MSQLLTWILSLSPPLAFVLLTFSACFLVLAAWVVTLWFEREPAHPVVMPGDPGYRRATTPFQEQIRAWYRSMERLACPAAARLGRKASGAAYATPATGDYSPYVFSATTADQV